MNLEILDLFQAGIGVYLLVFGIWGKGKIYENEFIKPGCEKKYHKVMRIFLCILGPLAILGAALSMFSLDPTGGMLVMICWGVTIAGFVLLIILTARLTSRNKPKVDENGKPKKNPAFDFDDDDEPAAAKPEAKIKAKTEAKGENKTE